MVLSKFDYWFGVARVPYFFMEASAPGVRGGALPDTAAGELSNTSTSSPPAPPPPAGTLLGAGPAEIRSASGRGNIRSGNNGHPIGSMINGHVGRIELHDTVMPVEALARME